jgi:hypothetical protein
MVVKTSIEGRGRDAVLRRISAGSFTASKMGGRVCENEKEVACLRIRRREEQSKSYLSPNHCYVVMPSSVKGGRDQGFQLFFQLLFQQEDGDHFLFRYLVMKTVR